MSRYTLINLHIFGPHPSTRVPRGNPPSSSRPVPRTREESDDVLTVSFVEGRSSSLGLFPRYETAYARAKFGKERPWFFFNTTSRVIYEINMENFPLWHSQ